MAAPLQLCSVQGCDGINRSKSARHTVFPLRTCCAFYTGAPQAHTLTACPLPCSMLPALAVLRPALAVLPYRDVPPVQFQEAAGIRVSRGQQQGAAIGMRLRTEAVSEGAMSKAACFAVTGDSKRGGSSRDMSEQSEQGGSCSWITSKLGLARGQ